MTAVAFAVIYVCAGCVVAFVLRRQGATTRDATLAVVIWPVSLTAVIATTSSQRPTGLRAAARAVEHAWGEGKFGDSRELGAVRAFIAKLSLTEAQIDEMSSALATASASVADKLRSLKAVRDQELVEGVRLLDELAGQLVLLRFAQGADTVDGDRQRIEEVLARIEALADLSSADAGAMDKRAAKC